MRGALAHQANMCHSSKGKSFFLNFPTAQEVAAAHVAELQEKAESRRLQPEKEKALRAKNSASWARRCAAKG